MIEEFIKYKSDWDEIFIYTFGLFGFDISLLVTLIDVLFNVAYFNLPVIILGFYLYQLFLGEFLELFFGFVLVILFSELN